MKKKMYRIIYEHPLWLLIDSIHEHPAVIENHIETIVIDLYEKKRLSSKMELFYVDHHDKTIRIISHKENITNRTTHYCLNMKNFHELIAEPFRCPVCNDQTEISKLELVFQGTEKNIYSVQHSFDQSRAYVFTYEDTESDDNDQDIATVFCKRCGTAIWKVDTRYIINELEM